MTREGQISRKEQNFLEPGYVYLGSQSLGAGVSYFWLSYTYSLSHPYHSGISKVFFFLASQEPVPCSRSSSTDLFSQSTPDSIPMTAIIICMLLSLRPDLSPDLWAWLIIGYWTSLSNRKHSFISSPGSLVLTNETTDASGLPYH